MFALILVLIAVVGSSMGQITMKSGMNQIGEITSIGQLFRFDTLFHIFTNPRVLMGIGFYGMAGILWLGALSTLNVSFMYPFMSLAYIITAIVAFIFLKEHISVLHVMGIIMIVGGCFLIAKTAY